MPPARKLSDPDWEPHRETIREVFLIQDRPLKDLMEHMTANHSFHASKSQYETRLKLWNFRKNLTYAEWEFFHYRIKKRKRDGKSSLAVVDGIPIPEKKLKKEVERRFPPTGRETELDPPTPDGLAVRTPPATSSWENTRIENLPWFRFRHEISLTAKGDLDNASKIWLNSHPTTPTLLSKQFEDLFKKLVPRIQSHSLLCVKSATEALVEPSFCFRTLIAYYADQKSPKKLNPRMPQGLNPSELIAELLLHAVYLLSNNLLETEQRDTIFNFVMTNLSLESLVSVGETNTGTQSALMNQLLLWSACSGNLEAAQFAIKADANIEIRDPENGTPLQIASRYGHAAMVRLLLDEGAHCDVINNSSMGTPLYEAVRAKSTEIVSILLTAGARDHHGPRAFGKRDLAIHQAAALGDVRLLSMILNAKPQHISRLDGYGESPLIIATKSCCLDMVRLLLDRGADVSEPSPLPAAILSESMEMVRLFLQAGTDIDRFWTKSGSSYIRHYHGEVSPLQCAAELDDTHILRLLLNEGASFEYPSALPAAAATGNMNAVDILLQHGADINAKNLVSSNYHGTATQQALINDDRETFDALVERGANLDPYDFSSECALATMALRDNMELIDFLLKRGVDINTPQLTCRVFKQGKKPEKRYLEHLFQCGTPLLSAVFSKNLHLAEYLLQKGAKANVTGRVSGEGVCTPLDLALNHKDEHLVRLLLRYGADVNALSLHESCFSNGGDYPDMWRTPIFRPVCSSSTHLLRILIEKGASAKAPQTDLNTENPLNYAETAEIMQILLSAGADVNRISHVIFPRTPIQAAAELGNLETVKFLLEAGAEINEPAAEYQGITALQAASRDGNIELVLQLLSAGAEVNAPGAKRRGTTALEGAAANGRLDIVQLLLNSGAGSNQNIRCRYMAAIDFAREEGHHVIAKILTDCRRRDLEEMGLEENYWKETDGKETGLEEFDSEDMESEDTGSKDIESEGMGSADYNLERRTEDVDSAPHEDEQISEDPSGGFSVLEAWSFDPFVQEVYPANLDFGRISVVEDDLDHV